MDGFIADAGGSVAWLDDFFAADYGFAEFLGSVDSLIMGRTTYDDVKSFGEWPYASKQTHVLTRDPDRYAVQAPANVRFHKGDVRALSKELHRASGARAWLVGGARTNAQFMQHHLIDEVHLAVMPVTLGKGLPLLTPIDTLLRFDLLESRQYDNGVMLMHYRLFKNGTSESGSGGTAPSQSV